VSLARPPVKCLGMGIECLFGTLENKEGEKGKAYLNPGLF
jgi:hypothetical protein